MSKEKLYRVNWFSVLTDIKYKGVSLTGIRDVTGIPESTLRGYKSGSEPKHVDGEKIIKLWCSLTCKSREHLPLEPLYLSAASCR